MFYTQVTATPRDTQGHNSEVWRRLGRKPQHTESPEPVAPCISAVPRSPLRAPQIDVTPRKACPVTDPTPAATAYFELRVGTLHVQAGRPRSNSFRFERFVTKLVTSAFAAGVGAGLTWWATHKP